MEFFQVPCRLEGQRIRLPIYGVGLSNFTQLTRFDPGSNKDQLVNEE